VRALEICPCVSAMSSTRACCERVRRIVRALGYEGDLAEVDVFSATEGRAKLLKWLVER